MIKNYQTQNLWRRLFQSLKLYYQASHFWKYYTRNKPLSYFIKIVCLVLKIKKF